MCFQSHISPDGIICLCTARQAASHIHKVQHCSASRPNTQPLQCSVGHPGSSWGDSSFFTQADSSPVFVVLYLFSARFKKQCDYLKIHYRHCLGYCTYHLCCRTPTPPLAPSLFPVELSATCYQNKPWYLTQKEEKTATVNVNNTLTDKTVSLCYLVQVLWLCWQCRAAILLKMTVTHIASYKE